MRVGRVGGCGLLVVAVLGAADVAEARRSCRVGDAPRLLSTSSVVVWQVGEEDAYRLYGCWRKTGRRTVLRKGAGAYSNPRIEAVEAAGPRIAVTTSQVTDTLGEGLALIHTADLRSGRSRSALLFHTTSRPDQYRGKVTALAIDRSGVVGLIIQYAVPPADPAPDRTLERVVVRDRAGVQRVISQAADIDPLRLELRDGSLLWRQAGAEKRAAGPNNRSS